MKDIVTDKMDVFLKLAQNNESVTLLKDGKPSVRFEKHIDMKPCNYCGNECPSYQNYCHFDCMIKEAKDNGHQVHTPNNLPINCIKADGSMWEHSHGDHPDYKFPVEVNNEIVLSSLDKDGEISYSAPQPYIEFHALIYTDGCVALTLYECCYHKFYLKVSEYELKKNPYQLTSESVEKIVTWFNSKK